MIVKYSRLKLFLFLIIYLTFLGLLINVFLIPFKYVDSFIFFVFLILSAPLSYAILFVLYALIIGARQPALMTDKKGVHVQGPFGNITHIHWSKIQGFTIAVHHCIRPAFLTYSVVQIKYKNNVKTILDLFYKISSIKELEQELKKEWMRYKDS